ncbi:DUF3267 domain-containing protein [Phosphitispora fastidiosa]|uniref:DUF3267 domain-containing protein n=1 Tax=Phosphitispora fastidiosa TaxID=2837202 RepID=UPI001E2A7497|nr:DUF3267 domain-containing protein [Phosphitispora fastidiosa]MBU7008802.1 hypothetical protein [Phosphitispora fastidiosa]
MKFVKKMPPTDRKLSVSLLSDGWKKIKEPTTLFFAILCSIPFMVVNGIVTYLVIKPFYDPIPEIIKTQSINLNINIFAVLAGLAIYFLLLVVHEFLHAIFIPHFMQSDKTCWGLTITGGYVCTTEKLTKGSFVVISIAPFVVISIILPIIIGLLGLMNWYIFFLAFINAMASSVDILNLILILFQVPPKSSIINNGFETYYK